MTYDRFLSFGSSWPCGDDHVEIATPALATVGSRSDVEPVGAWLRCVFLPGCSPLDSLGELLQAGGPQAVASVPRLIEGLAATYL